MNNTIKAEGNVVIGPAYATRRERIATAALQGMLGGSWGAGRYDEFARWAVDYADALIAELDKEQKG